MKRRHERPIKRTNPSGAEVWIARYTGRDGKRRSAGTFKLKREAQAAIDQAYDREYSGPLRTDTLGAYAKTWTKRYPRSERTNATNEHRLRQVLPVRIEGVRLEDWPFADLRRRHAVDLVAILLTDQQRAAAGATNILRTLSAMTEDAMRDELADLNPFKGVRIRPGDPRVSKEPRKTRVLTFGEMHRLAAAAGECEAMIRVLSDCGLRLGELLGLHRADLVLGVECGDCDVDVPHLHVQRTAHDGTVTVGTKRERMRGRLEGGRVVPIPPALVAMLRGLPPRIDSPQLFPTLTGRVWWEDNWRQDVWVPARDASGVHASPQDFRVSWVSLMRAAGVDAADLAAMAGHSVDVASARYTHALGRSYEAVRRVVE